MNFEKLTKGQVNLILCLRDGYSKTRKDEEFEVGYGKRCRKRFTKKKNRKKDRELGRFEKGLSLEDVNNCDERYEKNYLRLGENDL